MTYTDDCTLPAEMLEQIASQGFDVLPELIRIVINTAMQVERQKYLRAAPFEHSPDRQGHANGYKPKTVKTRLGEVTFAHLWHIEGDLAHSRFHRFGFVAVGIIPPFLTAFVWNL